MNKTSIVILSYNTLDYTRLCVESIRKHTQPGSYEIIIVDNASQDGSTDWLKKQPDLRCIYNTENQGFPKGCNQGMAIAEGTELLLLNSDTIVTPHWLEQLQKALYSGEKVGAVSCVTNVCSNNQSIDVPYETTSGILPFAEAYNKSDPEKWERRLRLVGFCFLLKRSIVEKIGGLDEVFTPGNFEDDDYSLRIIAAGYELLLCRDTFIHHFGSMSFKKSYGDVAFAEKQRKFQRLLRRNRAYFQSKWGVDENYAQNTNLELLQYLGAMPEQGRIVEIGCGCGADLLLLMDRYPAAAVLGIEMDEDKARIAGMVADVRFCKDVENDVFSAITPLADTIIIGDELSYTDNPRAFIKKLATCLRPGGRLFVKLHNAQYWPIVKELLAGKGAYYEGLQADERLQRRFTRDEILRLFNIPHYRNLGTAGIIDTDIEKDDDFRIKLLALTNQPEPRQMETALWLVSVVRSEVELSNSGEVVLPKTALAVVGILREMADGVDGMEDCHKVWNIYEKAAITADDFAAILQEKVGKDEAKMLVAVALYAYQHQSEEGALQLLIAGYKKWPTDERLLYTLAYLLNLQQEISGAYKILEHYEGESENILELRAQLLNKYRA